MVERSADADYGEVAIVCNIHTHVDMNAMDGGTVIQGDVVYGCACFRGSHGGMEGED